VPPLYPLTLLSDVRFDVDASVDTLLLDALVDALIDALVDALVNALVDAFFVTPVSGTLPRCTTSFLSLSVATERAGAIDIDVRSLATVSTSPHRTPMPKSLNFTRRCSVSRRFSGLMSLCTTPAS
jgi:hypothetical protein